jgi:hypothetical protein
MRYSSVTRNFKYNGSTLHQVYCEPPRLTELSVIMAMYNEANNPFTSIMQDVMKVITYLCRHWGRDNWKKVVVCIVVRRSTRELSALSQT